MRFSTLLRCASRRIGMRQVRTVVEPYTARSRPRSALDAGWIMRDPSNSWYPSWLGPTFCNDQRQGPLKQLPGSAFYFIIFVFLSPLSRETRCFLHAVAFGINKTKPSELVHEPPRVSFPPKIGAISSKVSNVGRWNAYAVLLHILEELYSQTYILVYSARPCKNENDAREMAHWSWSF